MEKGYVLAQELTTQSTTSQSFLNMLFKGGKKNWDPTLYLEYPGCRNKLNKDGINIINIYGSLFKSEIIY